MTSEVRDTEEVYSNEGFEAIARDAPVMTWTVDATGRLTFVNRAWEVFFDTTLSQLPPAGWLAFIHPDDVDSYQATFNEALRERKALDARCRVRRADGQWRWLHTYAAPSYGKSGNFLGLVGNSPDVTREVEKDAQVRENEQRFRRLADTAPVIIWMFEADGRCTFVSRAWEEVTGKRPAAALEFGWLSLLHPEDEPRVRGTLARALASPGPCTREFRLLSRDGSYRSMLSAATPRYSETGTFAGYIGSVLDISERKQQENALREAAAKKDIFLAILGHELRNPLGPLANAAALLRLKAGQRDVVEASKMIDRQVRHLARLVDDLLDVGRLVNGKLQVRRSRTALRDVVVAAVEATQPLIEAHGHDLTVRMPQQAIYLMADATRLAQVFINLLGNATKFTRTGGRISLTVECDVECVTIRVVDNGRGIAPEKLERIFEMFTQESAHTVGKQEGMGVGLALARGIVQMHEGSIHAESRGLGAGSVVTVRLPVMETEWAQAQAIVAPRPALNTPQPTAIAWPARRILVVDDNADSANSMVMLLELMGHEAYAAFSGSRALELLPTLRADAVVLDIGMPDMSGHEVARRVRSEPWGQEVLLIALTGFGQPDDIQRSYAAGFDHHLTKPVDSQELVRLVGSLQKRAGNVQNQERR